MRVETIEDVLLPGLNLKVRQLMAVDGNLVVDAAGCGPPGRCPQCERPATRVHSRYWRQISELPVGGRGLIVRLHVRRFFCDQSQCQRRTFVEQVAGLTEPRRRSSPAAQSVMRAVATELGGRPGQRLCAKLRLHGRRTALLAQLVAPPVPARAPRILGIDEFAFRKGRTYGTVLVDVENSRPVDVLPNRETGSVADWLQEHPGAEIVCRDRLMAFTKAIRQAAPDAREVADRWHLLQNLSTAVEKTCRRHRGCLRRPATADAGPPPAAPATPLLDRVRQRHRDVNELAATGLSLSAIGRRLQLDRKTVRRYRHSDLEDLLASAQDRGAGLLDPFTDYVQHRFQAGCTSSMQLYRELIGLGYAGGYHVVNRYVITIRKGTAVPAQAVTPSPRTITSWIMRPQETLRPSASAQLEAVRNACPEITAACDLAWEFTDMARHRQGHQLRDWIQKAEVSGPEAIGVFAGSVRQDLPAVTAGLTLPYSSGAVEGHVNRIKTIKRQMYGRASFTLLRARILLQP
ncbi:ISL3 family transposase [Streptomyces sp. ASQP_92]|uniref:ISL3 family transposase n=1 Tax=Streptomyces sp. ASQP_92 TaxID=2979116 RepID=UPI0021C10413|nr:ISL3 family transposase [Streptomyces sp. ASQP_92]MCT9094303.1 ISL3 family transposase [Streptomyces sp. ASQP_92]